jgi:hypothetical protein
MDAGERNRRRAELIGRDLAGALTADEGAELARLEAAAHAAATGTDAGAEVLTAAELRAEVVSGVDAALSRPLLSRFISGHAARVMRAQREFWLNAPAAVVQQLLDTYNRVP